MPDLPLADLRKQEPKFMKEMEEVIIYSILSYTWKNNENVNISKYI